MEGYNNILIPCVKCSKHKCASGIDFSSLSQNILASIPVEYLLPVTEIDNGDFAKVLRISSETSKVLAALHQLRTDILVDMYYCNEEFHSSTFIIIDVAVTLVTKWIELVAIWNKFLYLKQDKCKYFHEFLNNTFMYLVYKAKDVVLRFNKIGTDRGRKITKVITDIHSKVGKHYLLHKMQLLSIPDEKDEYVEFIRELGSLILQFVQYFIFVAINADTLLFGTKTLYIPDSFVTIWLEKHSNTIQLLYNATNNKPVRIRATKPQLKPYCIDMYKQVFNDSDISVF